jgi:nitrile hydratase beta subunit
MEAPMNGPQDMGGFTGFGPVVAEANEPVFHEAWESRAFAMVLAIQLTGTWSADAHRFAREKLAPVNYWSSSYYEYRFHGLRNLLVESGYIDAAEVETGRMEKPPLAMKRVPRPAETPSLLASGTPYVRPAPHPAFFAVDDKVRTRNINPEGHTRLPRYARGKAGEIVALHGAHVFPDSSAHGQGDDPQWLYTVRFSARELWGGDSRDSVCVDLWEPYLEAL